MVTLAQALQWRPKTPFYYGWIILGMASLGVFVGSGTSQDVMGGIQGFIRDEMKWSRSEIALAASAGTWCSGAISPLIGRLADRYGARWLLPIGAIIAGACFLVISEVHALWQFYFFYIPGRAVANSVLMGVVPRTSAVNFFRRKRNVALALTGMARPVGVAANIRIFSIIAGDYGWRGGYRFLAIMTLSLVLPMMLFMRRRPEDIGLLPDGAKPRETALGGLEGLGQRSASGEVDVGSSPAVTEAEFSWTVREALRTRAFWFIAIAGALSSLSGSAIAFSMVPYLDEEAQISRNAATGVLSLTSLMAITAIIWGFAANRFTPRTCMIWSFVAIAVVIPYLLTVSSLREAYAFGVLFGLFYGVSGILENMIIADYFGRNSFGSIIGFLGPIQRGALGLGPATSALARDAFGSYTYFYWVLAGLFVLGAVLVFFVRTPARPSRVATGTPSAEAQTPGATA